MFTFVRHYMNFILSNVLVNIKTSYKMIAYSVCTDKTFSSEYIWVSMRENLSPGRLKSAYSARILKKSRVASCVVCVLCLFLAVMWVSLETAIECFF